MSRISIFGLGYVGTVCSACFAQEGHCVIGVDVNKDKVDIINSGRSPIIEKDLESLITKSVKEGRLRATTDSREAILKSDVSLICVGTPSNNNGSLDLSYVQRVSRDIGKALMEKEDYHIVVMRSSALPGTVGSTIIPILEETSCKKAAVAFGVAVNPEFLRESSSIYDFYNPPKTVVGSLKTSDADAVAELYKGLSAPLIQTSIEVAEMIKYVDNSFHALKVTFANEIGNICRALDVDSHAVMNIFCKDTKLNISPYYLKPGFAFGGSCLPKDVRALTHKANRLDINTPVLNAIIPSNQNQISVGLRRIMSLQKRKVGILGFAFKSGTDDLRESPMVELIESLLGKGYDIRVYDKSVSLAKLYGANKRFLEERIPHVSTLMVGTIDDILAHAEVIVIGNDASEFSNIFSLLRPDQHVIDLVRITENNICSAQYEGIAW
ncbi:MAG: nucleotide sugar dehydrogenase [Planctomycetota bacterium]|jgi:GDP-mannose 6-dehydrogenase